MIMITKISKKLKLLKKIFFFLKEVLTSQKCAQHIIVRGLVRVRCVQEMDRVLHFMTRKGLINTGVLAVKRPLLPERYRSVSVLIFTWSWSFKTATAHICTKKFFILYLVRLTSYILSFLQKNVIIIGAGASGLAAARQLQNFGTQVTVTHLHRPVVLLCLLDTELPLHTVHFHRFTGGGARGEGENWRSCVGWYLSGRHCGSRSSDCKWLHKQPHRSDVWTGEKFL